MTKAVLARKPLKCTLENLDLRVEFGWDLEKKRLKLFLCGVPFEEFQTTTAQNSDRIREGKIMVNKQVLHEGEMPWSDANDGSMDLSGKDLFELKFDQTLGAERATSLIFDDLRCSSNRVSDELMTILAARVADDRLEEIRFMNSFGDNEL